MQALHAEDIPVPVECAGQMKTVMADPEAGQLTLKSERNPKHHHQVLGAFDQFVRPVQECIQRPCCHLDSVPCLVSV